MHLSEAELDVVLGNALFERGEFSQWFLSRTRFRDEAAECVFCRSNNPWSSVRLELPNAVTGELEMLAKQCETDVLAVYETTDGRRLALHIENKLAGGVFAPHQPELYKVRLQQWKNRPKLGQYSEATSVLIAPQAFFHRFPEQARIFEAYVPHEEIAALLPAFSPSFDAGT